MAHLTLVIKNNATEVFRSDFMTEEFIPIAKELTRSLEQIPELSGQLVGYKVEVTPVYDDVKRVLGSFSSYRQPPTRGLVDTMVQEAQSFYHPKKSDLCVVCRDRPRCPGSRLILSGKTDMVRFAANAQFREGNIHVPEFTLRILNSEGARLHEITLKTELCFMFLTTIVIERMIMERHAPVKHNNFEIYVVESGEPQIHRLIQHQAFHDEPIDLSNFLPRTNIKRQQVLKNSIDEPPETMVNWDEEPFAIHTGDDIMYEAEPDFEFDIQVIHTGQDELPLLDPYSLGPSNPQGIIKPNDLRIYLTQDALDNLMNIRSMTFRIGFLSGKPFRESNTGKEALYIHQTVPLSLGTLGGALSLDEVMHYESLRKASGKITRESAEMRLVGWYRLSAESHAVALVSGNILTYQLIQDEKGVISQSEIFIQSHFFSAPWQIGIIADPIKKALNLYRWYEQKVEFITGYNILKT